MTAYTLKSDIVATQLTIDNFELVERLCNGRIRGIKLPIEQQIVQFDSYSQHSELGEQELKVGDWLVQFTAFNADRTVISQVWPDKAFRAVFEDIDPTPF